MMNKGLLILLACAGLAGSSMAFAAEVAAIRQRQQAGRERRGGAAARAARALGRVVGIKCRPVDLVVRVRAHAELRRVCVSDG